MITFTGVELSNDQSHAKVFFTVLGSASDVDDAREGLQRAAGFLRSSLAHRLTTRKVPELHFEYDESVERGMRLSKLIDDAVGTPSPKPSSEPAAKPAARKPRGGAGR
jgi:ribosome-binding factor A